MTTIFSKPIGSFTIGAAVGILFFGLYFGLSIVNPGYTDWIFYSVTHDTTQHFIGWEFFRSDSTGGVINGLAYPVGLPITFMDSIPLLAFPFKLIAGILPANFQYFGIWAISCYVLMGGFAAVIIEKVWRKVFPAKQLSIWKISFVAAGALIFVLSPMVLARTLYHPALAAQWLILLGFILIWDAKYFSKKWKFIFIWSVVLIMSVLIHPYFLPMMGAMMLVAGLNNIDKISWRSIFSLAIKIVLPAIFAIVVFWAIGGLSLGSGAEVRDLSEKGFNLLSFANSSGYSSLIPSYANASSSPESMMWLGVGIWLAIIVVIAGHAKNAKLIVKKMIHRYRLHLGRNNLIVMIAVGLLIFSIGVRVDLGPITLFQYNVPDKIYEIWSAFRAAAREAWPFYYLAVLLTIYGLARLVNNANLSVKRRIMIASAGLLVVGLVQFIDLWNSPKATTKRESFSQIQNVNSRQFRPIDISDLVTTQKHLVILDADFRGDMSGTYRIAQTALNNDLTLNIGFFARIPDEIWMQQGEWRNKVLSAELPTSDQIDYIFATKDKELSVRAASYYKVELRDGFYFILK